MRLVLSAVAGATLVAVPIGALAAGQAGPAQPGMRAGAAINRPTKLARRCVAAFSGRRVLGEGGALTQAGTASSAITVVVETEYYD
ncbi:hypothetical protein [Caulobacter sp. UNC279MFTsu5.1]|uniref:hypothetical protein n=1 Tax=Caulobacter sp. UNC279MFTsu5.1 TaxID=1502775 RepID=UPI00036C6B8A|nr:hypothetical protein [Caulobacter sp. UNC279MFTsu5.1]SFK68531.1 hypothetical protein SAMN02799626_04915 [Caulobacter sp. UNC279MFTsu5.1]